MAQLWGGRFTGSINELAWNFNASISFDKRFLEQDVRGSKAHATMLAKQNIISEEEKKLITEGLDSILEDVKSGKLEITSKYEDIHSFLRNGLLRHLMLTGQLIYNMNCQIPYILPTVSQGRYTNHTSRNDII